MTNGDYIRQMDDETLARFLHYAEGSYPTFYTMKEFHKHMEKYPDTYTKEYLMDEREWVKEEVEI